MNENLEIKNKLEKLLEEVYSIINAGPPTDGHMLHIKQTLVEILKDL